MVVLGGTCKIRVGPTFLAGLMDTDVVVAKEVFRNDEDKMVSSEVVSCATCEESKVSWNRSECSTNVGTEGG
jgi:hypothetical protein